MHKLLVYTLFMAVCIIGCAEPEPEVVPPPPPPPPTAQELSNKVIAEMQLNAPIPPPTSIINDSVSQKMTTQLQSQLAKLSGQVNGEDARTIVRMRIDDRIDSCVQAGSWTHVLALIKLHKTIKPGSNKHIVNETQAIVQLKKPIVSIKGFLSDPNTGSKKALLDFFMPLENMVYSETMTQGEQLYGLRFEKVIGNDQGIVFYYSEAEERFDVFRETN